MRVIGTAGHVDHGKSTLIEALTGTHPDRLKEEREREMTIDLGFAWWTLPGGEEIGVVDVPGHRDFIGNMLAGIGGIDAVLLVAAADEGVMPQTREHLAILDLLQIRDGVVALNKVDMVSDADWLDLVEQDVRKALQGTVLAEAKIVRVSAKTGEGLDELQAAVEGVIEHSPPRPDLGKPRLPVDRVFSMTGFGTVVTGTLLDGRLQVGDEVEISPPGLRGRVRGLQTHKEKEEVAVPGSRTAVNISGVDVEQIERGMVLGRPGAVQATRRLDVRFRSLPDASQPFRHDTEVKLYTGAAEVIGRARLLGAQEIAPGEEGWLQLELRGPVAAGRGDRYILRRPSPAETLGGGVIVDAHPARRHKRFVESTLDRLEALAGGTPGEVLLQVLIPLGIAPAQAVVKASQLEAKSAFEALGELLQGGQMLALDGDGEAPGDQDLLTTPAYWEELSRRLAGEVGAYHEANPLRLGMPREELKSRMKLEGRAFNAAVARLVGAGAMQEEGHLLFRPGHQIQFNPQQKRAVDLLMERFAQGGYAPPTVKECQEAVGGDVFQALVDLGRLVKLSAEVVYRREELEAMQAEVKELIRSKGPVSVAQVRDHFDTSRRYVLALMEYLDTKGVTVRDGDVRKLRG